MRIKGLETRRYRIPLDPPFVAAWDPEPRRSFEDTVVIVEQVWTGNDYRNFNYLIACAETGEALAIDPALVATGLSFASEEEGKTDGKTADDREWHLLAEGKFATAEVDPVLYYQKGDDDFYIQVRLTNLTKKPIGVRLDYWKGFSPNQWGVHPQDKRGMINEGRLERKGLTDKEKEKLHADFASKKLTMIPPGKSVTYFRDFNGPSGRKKLANEAGLFLIISMDGQLFFTDGKEIENLHCDWEAGRDVEETDVVIDFPPTFKLLPKKALVVEDKGE